MKIYIDVGHGRIGEDSGAHGVYNNKTYYETAINLKIAQAVKTYLTSAGQEVTLSREGNVNTGSLVGKYGRADSNLINSANACKNGDYDLMISIHNNSSSNVSARGFVLYWKTGNGTEEKSQKIAEWLKTMMQNDLPCNNYKASPQGKSGDYYGILRLHDKPGVLVEGAFMSNAEDMEFLADDKKLNELAKSIAIALNSYCSMQEKGSTMEVTETAVEVTAPAHTDEEYEKLAEQVSTLTKDLVMTKAELDQYKAAVTQVQIELNKLG